MHYVEARRYLLGGSYFDAIATLNEAVRLDSEKAAYHKLLAQLLAQNPSCTEASQKHFKRAIELDPDDMETQLGLAALYEQQGLTDQARAIQEKAMSFDQDQPSV